MSTHRILFIGNSYTYFNELPDMFGQLARAAGLGVETASVTSGGKDFEWHWYNPETLDTIAAGGWNHVVLQEHSVGAVERPEHMQQVAARLVARIRAVGAQPVFYMTWARQHIPEMQQPITTTYRRLGRELGALVAPVGQAWQLAQQRNPELVLHTPDRSHPNVLGSYLAACVFYGTLFNAKPTELPNSYSLGPCVSAVIEADTARFLQEVARDTLLAEANQGRVL